MTPGFLYDGLGLIEDASLVDVVEDWSEVRSPGRARRRRAQGHRQNIRFVSRPRPAVYFYEASQIIVGHPAVIARLFRVLVTP